MVYYVTAFMKPALHILKILCVFNFINWAIIGAFY